MVPGSTLMYGSNFCRRTRSPRRSRSMPIEAQVSPLPRELTTPPVTKMCFTLLPSRFAASLGRARSALARGSRLNLIYPTARRRPKAAARAPLSRGPAGTALPVRPDESLVVLRRVHPDGGVGDDADADLP